MIHLIEMSGYRHTTTTLATAGTGNILAIPGFAPSSPNDQYACMCISSGERLVGFSVGDDMDRGSKVA